MKLLKSIIRLDEDKLRLFLIKELRATGNYKATLNNEFIFFEPKGAEFIPVVLVAHLDTAHFKEPEYVLHDKDYNVIWSPTGLGADDRAGVFAALMLAKKYNVAILFTHGEESGGIGARAFTREFPTKSNGYKMMLQLDRRGKNDVVFYSNGADDFQKYIIEAGFTTTWGSFSDISVIAPVWRVNSANLSVGYFEEHTKSEHLFVDYLFSTISKVENILDNPIPSFEYKEKWAKYDYNYNFTKSGGKHTGYKGLWKWDKQEDKWIAETSDDDYEVTPEVCFCCGEEVALDEGYHVIYGDDYIDANDMIEPVCCDACWTNWGGYNCCECGDSSFEHLAEYPQAVDLEICDKCYEEIMLEKTRDGGKLDNVYPLGYNRGEKERK